MIGIKEIMEKLVKNELLTEEEKFKFLHSKKVTSQVVEYLANKLSHLFIEVPDHYEDKIYIGNIFELMPTKKLEYWCWEITESAIVFLKDEDYIERGNLRFDEKTPHYPHSWICFQFENKEYVFDPVLNLLCLKEDYVKIFEIDRIVRVRAKNVKTELIKILTTSEKEEKAKDCTHLMKLILGDSYESYMESKKEEIMVHGPENINAPLYRNNAGYKAELEKGIIKRLTIHCYSVDG